MANLTEIVAGYRPVAGKYDPFRSRVPVDYVPNLARRRNYDLRSEAELAGGAPEWLTACDPVDGSGITHVLPEWLEVDYIVGTQFRYVLAPGFVEEDLYRDVETLPAIGLPIVRGKHVAPGVEYVRVVRILRESTGEVVHTIVGAAEESEHDCTGDTCPACHPVIREERPKSRKPRSKGKRTTRYAEYRKVFNGLTGEWEWKGGKK